jgi:hypothetical protein
MDEDNRNSDVESPNEILIRELISKPTWTKLSQ